LSILSLTKPASRFAETEATAALAAILARYEVSVDTALFPDIPGESIQVGEFSAGSSFIN
jgi:hypothetical protein